jgi:hypothetical protein
MGLGLASAQNVPSEMHYSTDGKILYTGGLLPSSGLYDRNVVQSVYLNFAQPNYWTLLSNNYASETLLAADMIYDGVTYYNVGVRFRGNTSYQQISNSQKKSFAVEMDFMTPDQNLLGYDDLKFNNGHQDATFMREVLYCRMAAKYTPVAKANYIHLYLNNEDWGLYPNIQAIEKTFLKEWFVSNNGARFRATTDAPMGGGGPGGGPNWGDGTAGMNYLGADTTVYAQYYTLKSSDLITNPWQMLVNAFYQLSLANADNTAVLEQYIDVDRALWFLAVENIFTDDDSYLMKGKMDYMIYIDHETGRTFPMEYDGNSTFVFNAASSNNWGPFKNVSNVNYPLLNKLLNIPAYRQRYLAHYRTILNETFTTANATALVNEIHTQIGDLVQSDPKKLYTYQNYLDQHPQLITFVTNRRNFLLNNPEVAQVAPVIASAKYYNVDMAEYVTPLAGQECNIQAPVTNAAGVFAVYLYYTTGLVDSFEKVQMFDDGAHNDGAAGDGVYGAQIPAYPANTMVRYYVEALSNNGPKSASYLPQGAEHDVFVYTVQAMMNANGVVINEFVAQNNSGVQDEVGEFEDWIELYNTNSTPIDLSGFFLSDNAAIPDKWTFPTGTIIPANGYLIVWADDEALDGPLHAAFRLSALGESVVLSDPNLSVVDQVDFGPQTANLASARIPNGTGNFVIQATTFGFNNELVSSITQDNLLQSISLYPNPAQEFVWVEVATSLVGKNIQVLNSLGQLMLDFSAQPLIQLDLSLFPSGMYFLHCEGEMKRLMVTR